MTDLVECAADPVEGAPDSTKWVVHPDECGNHLPEGRDLQSKGADLPSKYVTDSSNEGLIWLED
jgi:hypothetical protein